MSVSRRASIRELWMSHVSANVSLLGAHATGPISSRWLHAVLRKPGLACVTFLTRQSSHWFVLTSTWRSMARSQKAGVPPGRDVFLSSTVRPQLLCVRLWPESSRRVFGVWTRVPAACHVCALFWVMRILTGATGALGIPALETTTLRVRVVTWIREQGSSSSFIESTLIFSAVRQRWGRAATTSLLRVVLKRGFGGDSVGTEALTVCGPPRICTRLPGACSGCVPLGPRPRDRPSEPSSLPGCGGGSERPPSPPVRSPARWDKPGRVAEPLYLKPINKPAVRLLVGGGSARPPT